jgi:hypothetical protein
MLQIDYQRLRNLTTGILHTEIGHVYIDLEIITGEEGLMTHMLPRAAKATEPWLRKQVTDACFWDGKFDITHIGVYGLPQPTDEERVEMFKLFASQPIPWLRLSEPTSN